ncbi:MAG: peptidylprolyl isomerase [Acidobacteria bacterium]|nr:peptidylprolyl isomerase [Acidobacteriota bacterium]
MNRYLSAFVAAFMVFAAAGTALAQETEERVVDEVIAQVNEGVITLSRVKQEIKSLVDAGVEQGKTREVAEQELAGKKGELIAGLINEELILQRGKELNIDREVEQSVNQRFLQIMEQNKLKTLDALYAEMRRNGVNPDDIRELWRRQVTRELVIQQDVQRKVYWETTPRELQEYFNKNKERFTKPETVTLSEIFLGFAGRSEGAVRQRATDIVQQLRGGADFLKTVGETSDRPNAAASGGKLEEYRLADLDAKFAKAIEGKKVGEYTDPIEIDQIGVVILRVDARSAASNESRFDENAVRMAILQEKLPEANKKFYAKLREDAYIKINDQYRPEVAPILYAEERTTTRSDN